MPAIAVASVATIVAAEGFTFEYSEADDLYYCMAPGLPFRIAQSSKTLLKSFAAAAEIIHQRRVLACAGKTDRTECKVIYLRPGAD